MGKPTICIGEKKCADQLRSNCESDHRLHFRYSETFSTIPLLLKSEISNCACTNVQVGNDQENAQLEKDSHSKNQTNNKVLRP